MKISLKAQYAIEAMVYLAHLSNGNPIQSKVIASKIGTTENYLEQIFFKLRKADLITSVRGTKGGYLIKQPLEEITVREILMGVDEKMALVPCVGEGSTCNCKLGDICTTKKLWQKMNQSVTRHTQQVTVSQLRDAYLKMLQERYGEVEYYL